MRKNMRREEKRYNEFIQTYKKPMKKQRIKEYHQMKECYIDMHCHILPGVDDGAKDLAETKKMLEIAYAEGIRCIIATPHHHPHRGKAPAEKLREKAKLVREAAHEIDERFRVYLGTEVYFGQDVADKLKEGKILSMNRREYVLVEFPPSQTYSYIRQGIQQLQFAGYEVILAHVERYHCIAEDVELAEELYDMGVNLQVNADSITGGSGRKIRKFIEELMNRDMVFCVGTDAHDTKHRPPKMKKAAAHVEKRYGEDYTRRIFYSNAKSMLKKRD